MDTVVINQTVETVEILEEAYSVIVADEAVTVVEVGIQGPPGADGLDGVSDKNFEQTFTNQSVISVAHNLGKRPAVSVTDTAGSVIEGDVEYVDLNNLTVTFSSSFSGKIVCN